MIAINDLDFHYGDRAIYEGASLHIKPKERIGLIGANGTGKSTLLKLINGDLQSDGGQISKSNDTTIGFLNQDLLSYQSSEPILSVALKAFEQELEIQRRIDALIKAMEADYKPEQVEELAKLQERFEALDGYSIQAKAEAVLEGLGFTTEDLQRPLQIFSGGWRMRVMLAQLLLQNPSLLMLDEPTNHLDLPSIEWLETYLTGYEGAVIVVSHDREFINRTCNLIVESQGAQLHRYAGNYDFFLEEKALRMEIQNNAFKNQQQKIKQTEQFINRFRAKATKARQVQSKVKQLEKMDKVDAVEDDNAQVNFRFNFSRPSGKVILELNHVGKAYGDKRIFDDTTAMIKRGDKIALIGANGKGKSTLLRIIAGAEPIEGERKEGYNVLTAFYAQHQLESLNVEHDILEELLHSGSGKTELELRKLLGNFLFTDEEVFKKIKVLSGGERSRVALAKTLLSEANFLLLDEPTNHLDIQSVNVLVSALNNFEGSYVTVSHDRHFVQRVANKIWYIEDHEIREYPGTYDEYVDWREKRKQNAKPAPSPQKPAKNSQPKKEAKRQPQSPKEQKKIDYLRRQIEKLEADVSKQEKKVAEAEEELAKPAVFSEPYALQEATAKYETEKAKLDKANEAWEKLVLELEGLGG